MEKYIENPTVLTFYPYGLKTDAKIKKIFLDDLARNLWMGIKQKHLTNQFFNDDCLNAARYMRRFGLPKTPSDLIKILNLNFRTSQSIFGSNYSLEFVEELLPYITRKDKLKYIINTKKDTT